MKKYVILKKEEITQAMIDESPSSGGKISPAEILDTSGDPTGYWVISAFNEFATSLQLFRKLTAAEYQTELAVVQAGNEPNNKLKLVQTTHRITKGEQIIVGFPVVASPGITDLPGDPRYVEAFVRNSGVVPVTFNVDFDPTLTGWTLAPGEVSPPIDVKGITLLRVTSIGGVGAVQFLAKG